jgi:hypothetical protein
MAVLKKDKIQLHYEKKRVQKCAEYSVGLCADQLEAIKRSLSGIGGILVKPKKGGGVIIRSNFRVAHVHEKA